MSEQKQQLVTIDECINLYLDRSEQSIHKYMKCWHLAFQGMEQLGLDFFYRVKSVKLPVAPNFTVSLPEDFLQWSKVGVLNSNGAVIPLKYNEKLTTYADLDGDRVTKTDDNTLINATSPQTPIFYNYYNGYGYINYYGIPSGSPFLGTFKIDTDNSVILLDQNFGYDYIMFEYICSPQEGGIYYIPTQFKEALIAWIAWQDIAMLPSTRKGAYGDKEQRKRTFYNERRLARARYKPLNYDQAYELALEMQRMAVKS